MLDGKERWRVLRFCLGISLKRWVWVLFGVNGDIAHIFHISCSTGVLILIESSG